MVNLVTNLNTVSFLHQTIMGIFVLRFIQLFLIMASLSIVTLNTRGCRDSFKRFRIFNELRKDLFADIVFLQDTHTIQPDESLWRLIWRGQAVFSHFNTNTAGVAIIFKPKLNVNIIETITVAQGRILHVTANIHGIYFYLINVYNPTESHDKLKCIDMLKTHISTLSEPYPIILGGDFNCTLDYELDRTSATEPHPPAADSLKSLITSNSLTDAYRCLYPQSEIFTWHRSDGTASRLDRFYIHSNFRQFLSSCSIIPCTNSDHDYVKAIFQLKSVKRKSAYWCMNTAVLSERNYVLLINDFWNGWQGKKCDFDCLQDWWDLAKKHICILSQRYSRERAVLFRERRSDLQAEIDQLSVKIPKTNELLEVINQKQSELTTLLKEQNRGAWIRSRFQHINESDRPTTYFFNLENKRVMNKTISQLKIPTGEMVNSDTDILSHASDFYGELYAKSSSCKVSENLLLSDLPNLSELSRIELDRALSLPELTDAVNHLNNNKAPGIDGLPSEFYKTFWETIGSDLLDVFNESIEDMLLPISCRRAVVTLLPKKGDLTNLKNWRPVSLLCVDLKIFSKALYNRIRTVLAEIIHIDQSYCVPGRKISNNIRLITDVVEYSNFMSLPLGVVSLDQEKAFDRVSHQYLLNTLRAFGFGDFFVKCIQLLYNDTSCLLKINNLLSMPVSFSRGIRQGCSLSGALYSICIEPLLVKIRSNNGLRGVALPDISGERVSCSAYADDITALCTCNDDFIKLRDLIHVYESASNAKINHSKSEGFWVGSWKGRIDEPLGLKWNSNGLKILGIYIGNSLDFCKQNWENLENEISTKLLNWLPLSKALSFRGRITITNLLAASKLWHRLAVIDVPGNILNAIQKLLINFIWSGKHWLPKELLFLPLDKGGQGLVHLESRIRTFRIQYAQSFMNYFAFHPCFSFSSYFLKQIHKLNYDYQIFSIQLDVQMIRNIPIFYKSVLNSWFFFNVMRTSHPSCKIDVLNEPLFLNPLIKNISTGFTFCYEDFISANATILADILVNDKRIALEDLLLKIGNRSRRLLQINLNTLWDSIPNEWFELLDRPIDIPRSVYNYELSCNINDDSVFTVLIPSLCKKELYKMSLLKCYSMISHNTKSNIWRDLLSLNIDFTDNCLCFYEYPCTYYEGDLSWKVFHGALNTGVFLYKAGYCINDKCVYCGDREDLAHLFITCSRLQPLLCAVRRAVLFLTLADEFKPENYVKGFPCPHCSSKSARKIKHRICNWIMANAKMATYVTRQRLMDGNGQTDALRECISRMRARVTIEFKYHQQNGSLENFKNFWAIDHFVCSTEDDILTFNGI